MEGGAGNKENVGDLSPEFMKRSHGNEEREREEEIELSLGLSMNGRFGVDPMSKRLRRSSSVSNVVVAVGNGSNPQARGEAPGSHAPLVRASSMPSETLEWRRQEESQPVMSMEKLKNVLVEKADSKGSDDVDGDGLHAVANPHGQLLKAEATQTGSSSRPFAKKSVLERATVTSGDTVATDEESIQYALIDMPYVSTKGDGPNHNRIEGFLYRYKKAEEVKIVCVCHGMFLTPAEFVKHGGGGDVAQPLKHIVVNPFPLY